jgi:hypothetical protein
MKVAKTEKKNIQILTQTKDRDFSLLKKWRIMTSTVEKNKVNSIRQKS